MAHCEITEGEWGVQFNVRVVPRASKSGAVGVHDGALKIRLAAPPVDGAANKELIAFLAKSLKVGKREVQIVSGTHCKKKRVRVQGCDARKLRAVFNLA